MLRAAGPEELFVVWVLHDHGVRLNELEMALGVALMASAALRWLEEHRQ